MGSDAEKRLKKVKHGDWIDQGVYLDIIWLLDEMERLRGELAKYKSGDDHVFYKTPGGVLP